MNSLKNLEEAIAFVISMNTGTDLDNWTAMEEDAAVCSVHMSGGMNMRNELNLWHENDLTKWFKTIGIVHADDMSGIIFTSVHRRLNEKELELDKQVKKYQDFWKKQGYTNGIPTKG